MQLTVSIDGTDYTDRSALQTLEVERDIDGRVSTCRVMLTDLNLGSVDTVVGESTEVGESTVVGATAVSLQPSAVALKEIAIGDAGPIVGSAEVGDDAVVGGSLVFAGQVARLTRAFPDPAIEHWSLEATGWEYLLDTVTIDETWTNQSDRFIIQDAFGDYLPEITTANATVEQIELNLDITATQWTLRELVDFLAQLSNARWFVAPDKALYFFSNANNPLGANYDIDTDTPDNATTFSVPVERGEEEYSKVFNRVTVLGALSGSARLTHTANDAGSQSTYGIRQRTIVDDSLKTATQVQLRAEAEVESAKQPRQTGIFTTWRDGLQVGDQINVQSAKLGFAGDYIIKRMLITQETRIRTKYEVEFGEYNTRLDGQLRRLDRLSRTSTEIPFALPPAGSVDSIALADNAINRLAQLANSIRPIPFYSAAPSLPAPDHPTGSFYYNTTTELYYENVGGVWTVTTEATALTGKLQFILLGRLNVVNLVGLIQAGQIDEVNVGSLVGDITGGMIGALTITQANIANLTITGGKVADATLGSAKIIDLNVSKLVAGNVLFTGDVEFGTTSFLQFVNGTRTLRVDGTKVLIQADSTSKAEFTATALTFTRGTAITEISAAGVQIYGGSTGIGLGASTFATSPVQITSSSIFFAADPTYVDVNANGIWLTSPGTVNQILVEGDLRVSAALGGGDIRILATDKGLYVGSNQVVGARASAIANPAANVTDLAAWAASIGTMLRTHGLMAT